MRPRLAFLVVLASGACFPATLLAADLRDARYDAARDQIVAEIAYRGTNPDHRFTVRWGRCEAGSPQRTVGRVIDEQGRDAAREDFVAEARLSLKEIPCRPAIVTLRLGREAHTDVFVPRHIELLGGRPQRPYEEIGRIEARGLPGEQRGFVRQELRNRARALGADAVVAMQESARHAEPPSLPAGAGVQYGGRIYEARGIAVRFTDDGVKR